MISTQGDRVSLAQRCEPAACPAPIRDVAARDREARGRTIVIVERTTDPSLRRPQADELGVPRAHQINGSTFHIDLAGTLSMSESGRERVRVWLREHASRVVIKEDQHQRSRVAWLALAIAGVYVTARAVPFRQRCTGDGANNAA